MGGVPADSSSGNMGGLGLLDRAQLGGRSRKLEEVMFNIFVFAEVG